LLSRATAVTWLGYTIRLVRGALLLTATLLWLEFVLASLPWTRPYARFVLPWLVAPFVFVGSGVLAALPNVFYIGVIAAVGLAVLRIVHVFFRAIEDGSVHVHDFSPEWAEPTYKLLRVLVVAVTFVAAFPYIPGSSSPAFQGVSIFLGLLVSLSSSSAISNIIAGTILTYTGAFRMGDRVLIAGTAGDVVRKSLLTTHLRTIKNEIVAIPNSIVLGGNTVNYTTLAAERGLILHTTVTIGYDAPWRTVHRLLIEAALATDGLEAEPVPFVLQTALNDFYVSYEINAYTKRPHDMAALYARLHQNIQESFNKAGVEIMSPHYTTLRDGNAVTIPEQHRPEGYEAPRFGVDVSGGPAR
jgi:small-conductance mechanosensitive channel